MFFIRPMTFLGGCWRVLFLTFDKKIKTSDVFLKEETVFCRGFTQYRKVLLNAIATLLGKCTTILTPTDHTMQR